MIPTLFGELERTHFGEGIHPNGEVPTLRHFAIRVS